MHYLHRTEKPVPIHGSPEFFEKFEKELEEECLRNVEEEDEPEWYEVDYTEQVYPI